MTTLAIVGGSVGALFLLLLGFATGYSQAIADWRSGLWKREP